MSVGVYTTSVWVPVEDRKWYWLSGVSVTSSCEPSNEGTRSETWVLQKSSKMLLDCWSISAVCGFHWIFAYYILSSYSLSPPVIHNSDLLLEGEALFSYPHKEPLETELKFGFCSLSLIFFKPPEECMSWLAQLEKLKQKPLKRSSLFLNTAWDTLWKVCILVFFLLCEKECWENDEKIHFRGNIESTSSNLSPFF